MKNSTWTIGQQIAVSLVVPLVVLVCAGSLSYRHAQQLLAMDLAVKETYRSLGALQDLFSHCQDAETRQRGFLLTGEPAFLEPYNAALTGIDGDTEALRTLFADDPQQAARLEGLRPLLRDKLDELRDTIELRRHEGLETVLRAVQSGRGERAMDAIRANIDELKQHELEELSQRDAEATRAEDDVMTTLLGGTSGTVLLVLGLGLLIVRSINRRIEWAVRQIQGSAAELQAAATQQAQGAREQSTASSEVSTTMKELLSTSHQIAESTQRVSHIADETSAAALVGDESVQRARSAIDAVQRQVEQIVVHMLDFGKKSQEIGGILEIINELAEQTNILAINATIEAAGAGDAGRRFGVVADEIRKLADRVGGSTKEIRLLIEEIRAAANTTVIATESGSKAVDAGTRQFNEVAVGFKHIVELLSTTTDASREIELSTKQQATAVEQVNSALLDVARTARESEVSSSMTLKTSSELVSLSRELVQLIQRQTRA